MDDYFTGTHFCEECEQFAFEGVREDRDSTIIYDTLYPALKAKILEKHKDFTRVVLKYIDNNTDSLVIIGPYRRLLFIPSKDENIVFALFGADKSFVKKAVLSSPLIKSSFRTLTNPFFALLTIANAIYSEAGEKYEQAAFCARIYMTLRFYSSRQKQIFPFEANSEIMEYTINNLSDKFLVKTKGSVFAWLKHIAEANHSTIGNNLIKTHTDYFFKYFISNVSTNINNSLENIRAKYAEDYKNRKYMNSENDRYDDEKQTMKELSNLSTIIVSLGDRIYQNIKANPINLPIITSAANATKLSVSSIKSTIDDIIYNETGRLKEIIVRILQIFFIENPENTAYNVKSKKFYVVCMNVYKISNTKDENVIRVKEILDEWIREYGQKYTAIARYATLANFRKSIFIYLVQNIIYYS